MSYMQVIKPSDRAGTVKAVAEAVKTAGPFDAALLLMGNGAYEPFDEELFGPLVPHCRIVACVNAGYSEFDLEWFNKNKIYVTNTINAVAEPTADITVFLILAVLRDTSQKERNVRQGDWKNTTTPLRDPNGLVLGIVGMGKIGKVSKLDANHQKEWSVDGNSKLTIRFNSMLRENPEHSA
jgi:lactate dehydrogenase-like 2-hydroxyacid dehydrogenase